ncbi:3-oxoacyl-[acyl-carrier-protein] synthase 3 [Geothrix limicola]|uniref:Beta-ketoacyl-[acyl-carrier-protein] synthase III n=1 Tax=Geothrix limicola TaxID=2927978 RepID=A0ABQ5QCC8_9BACT|nr:beta-ketoacyl-ACP synthase III [Geothrix limicola]GLH72342.1 3-oxoacyl-[acyl-carrier-protein] synthase 3 [Geothrix limicola]
MNRRLSAPVGITATGQCFPPKVVTNDDLSKIMETNDEWIRTRTGIRERRWVEPGTGASQLGAPALQMALDNRGIKASELDLILVTTVTPDTLFPATACRIQHMVGATNAFGFDLNAACSGFLYALTTASSLVAAGGVKRVAVVGVDIMSTIINLEDRATSVLFGDGAGAVIVERVEEGLGIIDFEHKIDGSGGCFLYMPAGGSLKPATAETVAAKEHYIHQAGSEVFKNAVREMADNSKMLMDRNGFTGDQLKLFVPHQANIRIMDAAAKRLELDPSRMMVNIDKYANTTTATIPTALHQAFGEKRMAKGDLVALAAFGAGFTWGATLMRWAY